MSDERIAIRYGGTTIKLTPKQWLEASHLYHCKQHVAKLRKSLDAVCHFLNDVQYLHLEYDFNACDSNGQEDFPQRSELFVNAHLYDGRHIEIESEQWDWSGDTFEDALLDFANQLERFNSDD